MNLKKGKIIYKLAKYNDEYVMVEVSVPGERWEVEFSSDEVRIEEFKSDGILFGEGEIIALFESFLD